MEEQIKDLSDYLDAFRRRRGMIAGVFLAIFTLGVAAALLWPPTYRSSATILIEEQEVPQELVQSTVTSYATQRIQSISQRVMTRANLMGIIEKYGLYEDEQQRETTEQILERMRDDIEVEMVSAEVIDPRTGRPMPATIAFSIAYNGENPQKVQKVASELTTLYLNENLKERSTKASETFKFLSDEANRLNAQIDQLESQLAEFKEQNVNRLPELTQLNTQLMDRAEREIADIGNQLRALEDRKIYLQAQLEQLEPHGNDINMSPDARLKALRTEYISLSARYSPDHPDVIRLKREIEGLEQETGTTVDRDELEKQLDSLHTELATLQKKYAAEHPDVVKLKKAIAALQAKLKDTPASDSSQRAPDNPAYISMKAQLEQTENEMRSLADKRRQLELKMAEYEKRLVETPQVERRYAALQRELENAIAKHRELKAKEMQARVAQQLEQESKGERFTLIDPPALPEEPIKPNRPAIVFLSFVLALGGSLGMAAVGEAMDSSIRGSKGVANALHALPLAVIPYLESDQERRRRRAHKWRLIGGTAVLLIAAVLLVHFLFTPLDVLWFRALRKVSILTGMDLVG
ncbi:Wzz/FepE/Etk N-terminal domain-containing protein [Thiohalobacter sp. IOR34]|uniref:GumC family protein n=1 Tax=Thiohalobacter sp. IOR34 TaxID=3057176 RepID=UPI0025B045A2|nr:Wzz/FepE/Etk N-terminal domain-containing protein [Thiohalobacter sp. IOR34]WJW75213.1 Wzz/FepE/Etk N-terminal domain-containing protein [Thiohalobacter sp. IOR34]